ncbi:hypothetical protein HDV62DRAFT_385364 [Trichoderma sp. SZMC 28011]
MKCFISLVAFYGALATALRSSIEADNLPDIQNAAGVGLADTHKEGGDMSKRGICTNNALDCCCQCAESEAWPCIGCFGDKTCPHGEVTFETFVCTDNDPDCCCQCAESEAGPCIGCFGHKTCPHGGVTFVCTDNSWNADCCCQCAEAKAWPCYGCKGEKQCINLGHVIFGSEPLKVYGTT